MTPITFFQVLSNVFSGMKKLLKSELIEEKKCIFNKSL